MGVKWVEPTAAATHHLQISEEVIFAMSNILAKIFEALCKAGYATGWRTGRVWKKD